MNGSSFQIKSPSGIATLATSPFPLRLSNILTLTLFVHLFTSSD